MQRKELIKSLVVRRTRARYTAAHGRWQHHRDRALGRLEVIDWLLEKLGARKLPPRGFRSRTTPNTRKAG